MGPKPIVIGPLPCPGNSDVALPSERPSAEPSLTVARRPRLAASDPLLALPSLVCKRLKVAVRPRSIALYLASVLPPPPAALARLRFAISSFTGS